MDYTFLRTIQLNRRLSQNFLLDQKVLERIIENSDLCRKDTVLEVGAGIGNLTFLLAKNAGKVIAVEYDKRFLGNLLKKTSNLKNVVVITGDILKIDVQRFDKIVSNLPFHISSKFLLWLCNRNFKSAILLLQKEFVSRLKAEPGSKDYGRLTVIAGRQLNIETIENVPSNYFFPKPKIDIMLVKITRWQRTDKISELYFEEMITKLFTFRRKKLKKALRYIFKNKKLYLESLLEPRLLESRIYEISKSDFYEICRILYPQYQLVDQ